jgi:hypothetical protein
LKWLGYLRPIGILLTEHIARKFDIDGSILLQQRAIRGKYALFELSVES